MKVTIIGAGNVATQLALGLKKVGHEIVEVYNRSDESGQELARTVGASFTSKAGELKDAEVYIIAVKDDTLAEVAGHLKLGNKTVVHTSGTKSKDLLKDSAIGFGVFYPLQTMTKYSKVDFKTVPILVEGSSEPVVQRLEMLARSLSHHVHRVDEEQRKWIHVAAVFANNFTNHLWALAEGILKERGISFDILKPLIMKSAQNLEGASPTAIQTGPAIRGDHQLVQEHLLMLTHDPKLHKLYRILSESISKSPLKE
ncbi:MAG: DUF2520 domain-containing protein [Bacteroidetes bacterium]|nr:DUF2520 domain-containing protein [Bacteroidota bacterium]